MKRRLKLAAITLICSSLSIAQSIIDPSVGAVPSYSSDPAELPSFRRELPVFLTGRVVLEDGTPPPEPVVIERICAERKFPEDYTDANGRFSFQLAFNSTLAPQGASVGGGAGPQGNFGADRSAGKLGTGQKTGPGAMPGRVDLTGCQLRASLPGYVSESVPLNHRRVFDSPDVGTIILRRRGVAQGTSISFTSLAAPKQARNAYQRAHKATQRKNPNLKKALAELNKAVAEYDEYAEAWYLIGRVRLSTEDMEGARSAFEKALQADERYLNPYEPLVRMALQSGQWDEASELSARILQLNPQKIEARYVHAVANYNLGEMEIAEESVRALQKADDAENFPRSHELMGMILARKGMFEPAAIEFRKLLGVQPDSPSAADIRRQLNEWVALGVIKRGAMPKAEAPQE